MLNTVITMAMSDATVFTIVLLLKRSPRDGFIDVEILQDHDDVFSGSILPDEPRLLGPGSLIELKKLTGQYPRIVVLDGLQGYDEAY